MTDKIIVLKANVMAQDSKSVAYRDEGGTLRKAPIARVTVVESMDDMPQDVNPAGSGAPESAPPDVTDPAGVTENAPPPSDRPPSTESGAPVTPKQPKPSRKKTMATAQASTAAKKKVAPPKAKVAAKKAVKTESSGIRTIGGKAVDLSEYTKVKAPGGGTSYHNGDAVAEKLEGKTLEEVYQIASKTLKEDVKALNAKYKHLNLGMQRMALGNRMRKVLIAKEA